MQDCGPRKPVLLNIYACVFSFLCLSLFITCCRRVGATAGNSLHDLNLKIKIRIRGQKATDSRSENSSDAYLSLVEGCGCGNLTPGLSSTLARSCKSVQTNTKMLSDKVFFSFVVLDKGEGGMGRGLPEPRTLVKGNYILIPFRNLVYIWLPGTSANCLQCLSLCLLGVCVRCFPRAHHVTQIHTLTDRTVEGCDSPRTLHTLVLLLCKWIILIIVSTLCLFCLG